MGRTEPDGSARVPDARERAWLRIAIRVGVAVIVLAYVAQFFGAPGVLEEGAPAPEFSAVLDDGSRVELTRDGPGEVLVLSFWASWCGPCKQEAPILNALHDEGVRVVGVNMEDVPSATAVRSARDLGIRFRVLGERGDVAQRFGVQAVPTTYVLAADGTIVLAEAGVVTRRVLSEAVAKAREMGI